ncbi:hypothetical protein BD779DRAFT_512433 [Infundibulicybe gibba]|nr:hypothetical protein BD779DRAFT_512433 [Infundibulicybe gibba]
MHPDLFRRANAVPTGNPGPGPCNTFSSPSRRDEYATTTEQLLDAREMAAFLLGRGSFTASNGTTYEDHDYALALKRETSESHVRLYRRAYNVVRDTLGNKLLEISVPHYRRWKSSLDPAEIVYLSPKTTIRARDIDQLEHILISNPDFVDIQVRGFRISKTFIEVACSY